MLDLINDPRDLPLFRVILNASLVIPAAQYLYQPGRFDWWLPSSPGRCGPLSSWRG